MLETHKPGVLSDTLKAALGAEKKDKQELEDGEVEREEEGEAGEWIWKGMARWGYPPGWISIEGLFDWLL